MTPLSSISNGDVRCLSIEGDGPEVVRLKRLGICSGHRIRVVQAGDPMILEVIGSRIGLSRQLARQVMVETISVVKTTAPEGAAQ